MLGAPDVYHYPTAVVYSAIYILLQGHDNTVDTPTRSQVRSTAETVRSGPPNIVDQEASCRWSTHPTVVARRGAA